MNLQEIMKSIDHLSVDEFKQLSDYIRSKEKERLAFQIGTMDIDALLIGAEVIRNNMSKDAFETMLDAMSEEYIEPVDEDGWPL